MDSYLKQIVYDEGTKAYLDKVCPIDNPYEGVHELLYNVWCDGWWDMFYEDN